MEEAAMEDLRFPIGPFSHEGEIRGEHVAGWIDEIEALPGQMRSAVAGLSDEQLDTRYRPGGWTLRQTVHHVGDSHLNSYVRFKWALTEDEPVIKAYDEAAWAELADYRELPIETSLEFLDRLHARWVVLLRSLTSAQLARRFHHPDSGATVLAWNVGNYAWHGRHHLAHCTRTIEREGW